MTPRGRRLSAAATIATAIAIPAEGLRQWAYEDVGQGVLTVCFGHTGNDVKRNVKFSLDNCKALLDKDMLHAINTVELCHPNLPDNVLAAFGDAVYNIGPKVACDSTASKYLSQGMIGAACNELPKWSKARVAGVMVTLPGLAKRRAIETDLCLGK